MAVTQIESPATLSHLLETEPALAIWFTSPDCGLCKALTPRIERMVEAFPRLRLARVDVAQAQEVAGQWQVMTVPALLIFFEGREHIRAARHLDLAQIEADIRRGYGLLFDETP